MEPPDPAAVPMPVSLSIKHVPDALAEALRQRAERNHRSMQGELLAILESALSQPVAAEAGPPALHGATADPAGPAAAPAPEPPAAASPGFKPWHGVATTADALASLRAGRPRREQEDAP